MATIHDVVDRARSRLDDEYRVRVDDVELADIVNDFVKRMFSERPDLFIGSLATSPGLDKLLSETYPLPEQTIPDAVAYVVSWFKPKDQEE